MDNIDRQILNKIQVSFPVDPHPYRLIGRETGLSEIEAWERVQNLKTKGIIRRIGGIFDSRSLGYVSTLCAAKVPADKIPVLKEITQEINEITHNYLRNHLYNIWFTVIASSQERLEEIISIVRTAIGSDEVYSLPASKIFKIGVNFKLEEETKKSTASENMIEEKKTYNSQLEERFQSYIVTEEDKALIRRLQDNLPDSLNPFSDIAVGLHSDEEQVITSTRRLLEYKVLRRLGAILYHQKAGFTFNAMGVWIVPEEQVNEVGFKMAEFQEVSHCYQRPTLPDWPYNIFTMIHGQSKQECEQIMASISQVTKADNYEMLFSLSELKKCSMSYF